MKFKAFFKAATNYPPYPYQESFATAENLPHLLRAPTSAGKTATAVLGWLWRQRFGKQGAPRRLAFCLPMRVLVEQSQKAAEDWLKALQLNEDVAVRVLMGGVEADEWFLDPEKPAILIGTQDMLLSRALNRGYAASRFHWPIDFGLLNNDCLWIFDEPQLMGSGVSTSAQLAGLRAALGTFNSCPSVWMSATLEPTWLDTIDFRGKFASEPLELSKEDYDEKLPLYSRMTAQKKLALLDADWSKDMKSVAKAVLAKHKVGTQTLVVVNTVERAKNLYDVLRKERKSDEKLLLVHSRYRPAERSDLNDRLQTKDDATHDRIIVATQVVEAGVDISSRTLVTELAPWASLVQRMGRCNRTGHDGPGEVYWIDFDETKSAAPYEAEDLKFAREQLKKLEVKSVSPKALDEFKRREKIHLPFKHKHVIRRRDLIDLFDTSPDLSGNDIDIQRFVRGDDPETDVQVFWRTVGTTAPAADEPTPERQELCNVPVGECKAFLDDSKHDGYVWDHLEERWRRLRDSKREVRPGMVILLPSAAGGYSELGWDRGSTSPVSPVPRTVQAQSNATSNDPDSCGPSLTLGEHTQHVCIELQAILSACSVDDECKQFLTKAAWWHDVGKAHAVFQATLRRVNAELDAAKLWAKSGKKGRLSHARHHFRHELASALAAMQHGLPFEVAYLIACHHGKVRLSIRSFPAEDQPDNDCCQRVREQFDREPLYAAGVWDGDFFGPVALNDSDTCPATTLDLSPMQLGGDNSWTGQALTLRDKLGPFKLAYLEALLRAADLRASKKERQETGNA